MGKPFFRGKHSRSKLPHSTVSVPRKPWQTLPEPAPMPAPLSSGYAPINGIELYYATYGQGESALLIHGGLSDADVWSSLIANLSRTHKVIVADTRGHGRSTRTAEPFNYGLLASDYLGLLDHLGIDRTALIGWSDGGIIGMDIAIRHPDRLSRLFAQSAKVTVDGVNRSVLTNETFCSYLDRSKENYFRLSRTPSEYQAFSSQVMNMWQSEPSWTKAQLAAIVVPTAIVAGDHEEVITREHTEYIASTIPGATLIMLPEVSHFAILQDPESFNNAARDFIEGN